MKFKFSEHQADHFEEQASVKLELNLSEHQAYHFLNQMQFRLN